MDRCPGARRSPHARGLNLFVTFHPSAARELEEAATWYEARRPDLGQAFLDAVDQATELTQRWPETGVIIGDTSEAPAIRQVSIPRVPYSILYQRLGEEVRILAVAHSRRRPGYWRKRTG